MPRRPLWRPPILGCWRCSRTSLKSASERVEDSGCSLGESIVHCVQVPQLGLIHCSNYPRGIHVATSSKTVTTPVQRVWQKPHQETVCSSLEHFKGMGFQFYLFCGRLMEAALASVWAASKRRGPRNLSVRTIKRTSPNSAGIRSAGVPHALYNRLLL